MGCGCRKNRNNDSRVIAVNSASAMTYQVWRNGSYTGRSFTSLVSAQNYANRINGEVRTK
jgi:hypothetical protein